LLFRALNYITAWKKKTGFLKTLRATTRIVLTLILLAHAQAGLWEWPGENVLQKRGKNETHIDFEAD
jgi:hypothetical protein